MSALGPMAGPPPDQMPLPPGMMGGGPGGPPAGPGGPPGGPGGPGGSAEGPEEEAALHAAADALHHAFAVEEDPGDKAMIAGMLKEIHKLLANRDDERQQAAGAASPALKLALRQNR